MGTKHFTTGEVHSSRYPGRSVNVYPNTAGQVFQSGTGFDYNEPVIADIPGDPDCAGVGNDRRSGIFTKNDCGTGTSGTAYEYVVAANTYFRADLATANAAADADIAANGQTQANIHATCIVTSKIGTLLIDVYTDQGYNLDLCCFVTTPGTAELNTIVTAPENNGGATIHQLPNDGRDPATCYLISSNKLPTGPVVMRFGINMAYFIAQYPGINIHSFRVMGRGQTAGVITGLYALRNISEGYLTYNEYSPGTGKYIPGVSGASVPTTPTYSSHIVAGGDGTVGTGIGSPILDLSYNVSGNTLTPTTY